MCYLMRDLLTQTTKCVAHLKSHGRGAYVCVCYMQFDSIKCVCVCVWGDPCLTTCCNLLHLCLSINTPACGNQKVWLCHFDQREMVVFQTLRGQEVAILCGYMLTPTPPTPTHPHTHSFVPPHLAHVSGRVQPLATSSPDLFVSTLHEALRYVCTSSRPRKSAGLQCQAQSFSSTSPQ